MKDEQVLKHWNQLYSLEKTLFQLLSNKKFNEIEKMHKIYEKENIIIEKIIKVKNYDKIENNILKEIKKLKKNFFDLREKNIILMAKIINLLRKEIENIPKLKKLLKRYSEDLKKKLRTSFDRKA